MIAILIECDNTRTLGGSCERDLYNIHTMLVQTLKLIPTDIFILTNSIPYFTKRNINTNLSNNSVVELEKILKNMINKPPNSVYIHISGHGYQGPDVKNIELDGRCEQIILSSGTLRDYQFNDLLKKYIQPSIPLRISVDTCHSGTFSNFCYVIGNNIKTNSQFSIDKTNSQFLISKTLASKICEPYFTNAYSISACNDSQLDSCDIGSVGGFGGSLTCHILENNNLVEFLTGNPIKVKNNLLPILKLLNQEPILLIDN
jgi:hypothetical protein